VLVRHARDHLRGLHAHLEHPEGTRLGLAFASMVALIGIAATAGVVAMHQLQSDVKLITEVHNVKLQLNVDMQQQVHIANRVMRTIILLDNIETQQREKVKITKTCEICAAAWDKLQTLVPSGRGRALRAARSPSCRSPRC
jgi:hypothetical protein